MPEFQSRKYILWDHDGVLVEDSGRGLKSALAAGIDCVIVENDFTRFHDFSRASRVVASIRDLVPLFC